MGEYAEMMLDGTCCEGCGEFIGDGDGFPRYCSPQCAADRGVAQAPRVAQDDRARRAAQNQAQRSLKKFCCTQCDKRFRVAVGLAQHERDKHGASLSQDK